MLKLHLIFCLLMSNIISCPILIELRIEKEDRNNLSYPLSRDYNSIKDVEKHYYQAHNAEVLNDIKNYALAILMKHRIDMTIWKKCEGNKMGKCIWWRLNLTQDDLENLIFRNLQ